MMARSVQPALPRHGEILEDALAALAPRSHDVLRLKFGANRSPEDIQRELAISNRRYERDLACAMSDLAAHSVAVHGGEFCASRFDRLVDHAAGLARAREEYEVSIHLGYCNGCRDFVAHLQALAADVSEIAATTTTTDPRALARRGWLSRPVTVEPVLPLTPVTTGKEGLLAALMIEPERPLDSGERRRAPWLSAGLRLPAIAIPRGFALGSRVGATAAVYVASAGIAGALAWGVGEVAVPELIVAASGDKDGVTRPAGLGSSHQAFAAAATRSKLGDTALESLVGPQGDPLRILLAVSDLRGGEAGLGAASETVYLVDAAGGPVRVETADARSRSRFGRGVTIERRSGSSLGIGRRYSALTLRTDQARRLSSGGSARRTESDRRTESVRRTADRAPVLVAGGGSTAAAPSGGSLPSAPAPVRQPSATSVSSPRPSTSSSTPTRSTSSPAPAPRSTPSSSPAPSPAPSSTASPAPAPAPAPAPVAYSSPAPAPAPAPTTTRASGVDGGVATTH